MNDRHHHNGAGDETVAREEQLAADATAAALDQLDAAERATAALVGAAKDEQGQIKRLAEAVRTAMHGDAPPCATSGDLRATLVDKLQGGDTFALKVELAKAERRGWLGLSGIKWAVVGGIACVGLALLIPAVQMNRKAQRNSREVAVNSAPTATAPAPHNAEVYAGKTNHWSMRTEAKIDAAAGRENTRQLGEQKLAEATESDRMGEEVRLLHTTDEAVAAPVAGPIIYNPEPQGMGLAGGGVPSANYYYEFHDGNGAQPAGSVEGYGARAVRLPRILADGEATTSSGSHLADQLSIVDGETDGSRPVLRPEVRYDWYDARGAEQYDSIVENPFLSPKQQPLSTFSIDVDTASYANVRRFLNSGSLPPPAAVRIEEFVNYFRYDYPQPTGDDPFSVNMEATACPWNDKHLLLRVGLKGKEVHRAERPLSNLVFLIDVSGSMDEPNKLPLVKESISLLVQELGENDRVSLAVYAGNAGLVLPPTSGDQKQKILGAIESLTPVGSTHGSAGIQLAYEQAAAHFRDGGTNRVILATDGDLNVGVTDDNALVELIKEKAAGGVFLTVLGFGEGNLKDSKMEKIADNGNGMYAYIDSIREGRKVLVEQLSGSIVTIAKDVKVQIEFNPAQIDSYRLVGYENRVLAAKDFNDDKKDAGEIGAGHAVTALYELVPAGAEQKAGKQPPAADVDPLKYQQQADVHAKEEPAAVKTENLTDAAATGELLTLKLRYKQPDGDVSKLLEYPLKDRGGSFNGASADLQFAASVASFGMLLRHSEHRGSSNLAAVSEIAAGALGKDDGGYRAEFVELVKKAGTLGVK